ncbi:MAG: hypothetical protein SFV23_20965, partial [Planctomycetaceae bacterium]|nr:hypothetical protein [Planctomycetaceae bacterium]
MAKKRATKPPGEFVNAPSVFLQRIEHYTEVCGRLAWKCYSKERPEHIPAEVWNDPQQRLLQVSIPADSPRIAIDAQNTLQHVTRVAHILADHDWPPEFDAVFCHLIDVGALLQRMHDAPLEELASKHAKSAANLLQGNGAKKARADAVRQD